MGRQFVGELGSDTYVFRKAQGFSWLKQRSTANFNSVGPRRLKVAETEVVGLAKGTHPEGRRGVD